MTSSAPASRTKTPRMLGTGRADRPAEQRFETLAEVAAVCAPEHERQREGDQREPGAKRGEARQVAARDHQRADRRACDRQDVRGTADQRDQTVADRLADVAAVPARVEDRSHEQAEGGQPEADQLRVMVPLRLARPFLDPRRRLGAYLAGTLPARHARHFAAARATPSLRCRQSRHLRSLRASVEPTAP